MRFTLIAVATAFAALSSASAQGDALTEHYRAYATASSKGDWAHAETAAEAALQVSRDRDGDGGKTPILAFNLAHVRLTMGKRKEAIEPARLAVSLAPKSTGIDPLAAQMLLGEAIIAEDFGEAKRLIMDGLDQARAQGGDVAGIVRPGLDALGKAAAQRGDSDLARKAHLAAADFPTGGDAETIAYNRALSLMHAGIAEVSLKDFPRAVEIFDQAYKVLSVTPIAQDDVTITAKELAQAYILAWRTAAVSRYRSTTLVTGDLPAPLPKLTTRGDDLCHGKIKLSGVVYPKAAYLEGYVGAAVVRLKLDQDGKLLDKKVLASVPADDFRNALLAPKVKWTLTDELVRNDCTRKAGYAYVPIMFTFRNEPDSLRTRAGSPLTPRPGSRGVGQAPYEVTNTPW